MRNLQVQAEQMDLLPIVFLVVFRATEGSRSCNLSDAVGAVKCSGTLGEPLSLQLTLDAYEKEMTFRKISEGKNMVIFKLKTNVVRILHSDYVNRSKFTQGTFRLDSAERTDRGFYQLQVHSSDGKFSRMVNMTLEIQAPVSEPVLSLNCLSGGETQVTCSSEGDHVEYRWSLANQSQTNISISDHSHPNTTITLNNHMTGSVTCEAQNDVSTKRKTIHLSACSESADITLIVTVSVSVATLLLFSLFLSIRHFLNKATSHNVHSGGGGEEVIYADVKIGRRRERATPSPVPQDVVYGQIVL